MYKQVQKLTSFIKPSSPNAETTARVKENTDQWMLVNMNILKLHYDQIIAKGIQDLPPFNLTALEKAIGFGKTRYRAKLTATSISTLTTLIKTNTQTLPESGQENIRSNVTQCPVEWPELGQPGNPESATGQMAVDVNNLRQRNPNREHISRSNLTINPHPDPNLGLHSNHNPYLVHDSNLDPNGIPNTIPGPNPNCDLAVGSNPNSVADPNLNQSLAVRPDPTSDPNPNPKSQEGNIENPGGSPIPLGEGMNWGQVVPKQVNPEIATGRRLQVCVVDIHGPPHSSSRAEDNLGPRSNFELRLAEGSDLESDTEPQGKRNQESHIEQDRQVPDERKKIKLRQKILPLVKKNRLSLKRRKESSKKKVNLPGDDMGILSGPDLGSGSAVVPVPGENNVPGQEGGDLRNPIDGIIPRENLAVPSPGMDNISLETPSWVPQKPTRHQRTYYKMVEWNIQITKPVVILGDSNLSRIPEYCYPQVQIDSFPGAKILHIKAILKKLPPMDNVQKVVISVGLNNCLSRNKLQTMKNEFQQLMSQAKKTFPQAELWVPWIQFSPQLGPETKRLFRAFNLFLEANFITLGGIEEHDFVLRRNDDIHWTSGTAKKILKYWMTQLN